MTDIGYCNTCKNNKCEQPRVKVVPQRDCPKGLAWDHGRGDEPEIDDYWFCPGCDSMVETGDLGGYRTYCVKCVEALPELPSEPKAYVLVGKYPDFSWQPAADYQVGTRAVAKLNKKKKGKKK